MLPGLQGEFWMSVPRGCIVHLNTGSKIHKIYIKYRDRPETGMEVQPRSLCAPKVSSAGNGEPWQPTHLLLSKAHLHARATVGE